MEEPGNKLPTHPKLRPVDMGWIKHEGKAYISLRDQMALSQQGLAVPKPLAPFLSLCDGTRDLSALQIAFALTSGVQLPMTQIEEILSQLDSALLLENGSYRQAAALAMADYRNAPHRKPAHAGDAYPEDPNELSEMLDHFCNGVAPTKESSGDTDSIVGILSPHIDYQRGGDVYARVWKQVSPFLQEVELAIILGTDHYGSPGKLTLTRQDYATPWGVLPTNQEVVDALADAIGPEDPFTEEIHHINEHSIELALVWLHHFLGSDTSCSLVPILCGSFAHITNPDAVKAGSNSIEKAIPVLKKMLQERKAIVVAAADLAHVGPNFGDDIPVDFVGKAKLGTEDSVSLGAISMGDAEGFLQLSVEERDKRRICGLPPIYMMLRLLDGATGQILSYSQCPADQADASFVSIAGALMYK